MKKFFRLVSMLAVAGLTFAYTSCTDYSEDVNRLDERIDGHVADVNTQVEELKNADTKLQTSIDAANKAIEALQANTESLQTELTKLSEKHDADIKALEATHAADKAALEKALADKAAELKTALETLDAKYAQKVSDLEAAYKQADVELKNQILQNLNKITTLEADVKNINEVVIPAVKKQIEDLAANVEATYATKVELTQATGQVTALINSEVAKLNTRLEDVESRLTTLETAHNALKESFEETKAAHAAAIKTLEGTVATLTGDVAELKTAVKAAKAAADKAQEAADAAATAADEAQKTADAAATAADEAQKTADAAKTAADKAVGDVSDLITALGVYTSEGKINAKFGEILEKATAAAAKNDSLIVAGLSGELKTQVDKIRNYVDSLGGEKLNTADFAKAFKNAFENEDFKTVWDEKFKSNFDILFKDAIEAAIKDNGVVDEKINEKVKAAKDSLGTEISNLDQTLSALSTKVGDILLVVGKLAERIQSITFVPEYDDFCATLYYYMYPIVIDAEYQKDIPVSDKKTVVAKFEVYPKSQAAKVAEMLKSGEGASLVAVPLKASYTRGAAEATKAEIIKAEADENTGVVSIEAVFGAEVNYYDVNPEKDAVSFAISLRVESAAVTEVRNGEAIEKTIDAGKHIESAYVPVRLSGNSRVSGFCLYDFKNEKAFEDTSVEMQWSAAPDTAKWNYFAGYDYAVIMYDRDGKKCVKDLVAAAKYMNIDVEDIKPSFTVYAEPSKDAKKFFDPQADSKGYVTSFNTLADCYIEMNQTAVKANVEEAVGSTMKHYIDFVIPNLGTVCHYDVYYEIIRRQVNFTITPADVYSSRIDWTYAKAVELTKNKKSGIAYDKDIIFKECNVVRENDKAKLGEILKMDPTFTVKINNEKQTVNKTPIKIEVVAQDAAEVAKVTIPGRTYTFAQGVDNIYEITATYAVDGKVQTDYNVSFNYTLGGMPKDQTVTLPAKEINFKKGVSFFTEEYDEKDYISQLTVAPYFNDAKELWTSVNEDTFVESVTKYYKGEENSKLDRATTLNVTNKGVTIGIVKDDLKSFDDCFGFTVVRKTWYDVTYTFKTENTGVSFGKPVFRLAPAPDRLTDNWTGTIDHEAKYDKYVLEQDIDLSKYVTIDKYDGTEDKLTITFAQKTKADDVKGIINVPVINTDKVAVIPNATAPKFPTIESSFINWLTQDRKTSFTAREDQISVVLELDGILLDSHDMTLSTDRPITEFGFDDFVQKIPEGSTSTTVNLWNKMIIKGVLQPDVNVVLQTAKNLETAINWSGIDVGKTRANAATYDCKVIFPNVDQVRVYIDGVLQPTYNSEKFKYNPAEGTITFTGDLASLQKPVKFEFDATLSYVLDYVQVDKLPATASVTFKK